MDYITFGIVIDEIVQADGTSSPDNLGGGGPQTAFGMRLWSGPGQVGIVARVGGDMPAAAWRWLEQSGIDTAGLTVTGYPTLRARQALDATGRRRHEWQVPGEVIGAQLARSIESLPRSYRSARGWHLGVHPEEADLGFLRSLRELGGRVSVETFRPAQSRQTALALTALLTATDIFSPNSLSAESLVGPGTPEALAGRLLVAGAGVVALRRGAEGSLVAEARSGQAAFIPAARTNVVDVVGAGNAYCGGFLTGWVGTGDIVESGLRGAAAASLLLEEVGVPVVSETARAAARERVEEMRAGVRRIII